MKTLIVALALLVSGCANVIGYIPSFWDDNQSHRIIDLRLAIERVDCAQPQRPQVARIRDDLEWFRLYAESKGARQQDVLKLTQPMAETADEWFKRVSVEGYKENPVYCSLKKKLMTEQAARASKAVLGRF